MTADFGVNQGLVEEQFLKWVDNPLAVGEAWRRYFEGLQPTDWPQISSAGMIIAPITATGALSPAALPTDGNGAPLRPPEPGEDVVRNSLFLPETAEASFAPHIPDETPTDGRASFPPSSEVLAATALQARLSLLRPQTFTRPLFATATLR